MDLEIRTQSARHGKHTGIRDQHRISAALVTDELYGMFQTVQIFFCRHYVQRNIAFYAVPVGIRDPGLHLFLVEVVGKSAQTIALARKIDRIGAVFDCRAKLVRIACRA